MRPQISLLSPFIKQSLKVLAEYTAALYLMGFAFFGTNQYGLTDAILPYEKILLLIVGVYFASKTIQSSIKLAKSLRGKKVE